MEAQIMLINESSSQKKKELALLFHSQELFKNLSLTLFWLSKN